MELHPWLFFYRRAHRALAPNLADLRLTDGCLWDRSALGSALYAQSLLRTGGRPLILVVSPSMVEAERWWCAPTTEFDEMPHFAGAYRRRTLYEARGCRLELLEGCRVRPTAWCARWTSTAKVVDVALLCLDSDHLSTLVFHATPSFALFERDALYHMERALPLLPPDVAVHVALSGGGTRAAVAGHTAPPLGAARAPPHSIAACSGGGPVVYACVGDRSGLGFLVRNGPRLTRASYAARVLMAIANDALGASFETRCTRSRARARAVRLSASSGCCSTGRARSLSWEPLR